MQFSSQQQMLPAGSHKGKAATRGQQQIYAENRATIRGYALASTLATALVGALNYALFAPATHVWVSGLRFPRIRS